MKVVSFFSGCGGLDLGFEQAGFEVVWANDNDPAVSETYQLNHPNTYLCKKDMRELTMEEIPECDGFIGGPPCQSWSEGGKQLGLDDERGKMFLTYIQFIQSKRAINAVNIIEMGPIVLAVTVEADLAQLLLSPLCICFLRSEPS